MSTPSPDPQNVKLLMPFAGILGAGITKDYSPNEKTATVLGRTRLSAAIARGLYNQSGEFSTNNRMVTSSSTDFDFTGEWVLETWLFMPHATISGSDTQRPIFSFMELGSDSNRFQFYLGDSVLPNYPDVRLWSSEGIGHYIPLGSVIYGPEYLDKWTHIAAQRNADGRVSLFLDGVLKVTGPVMPTPNHRDFVTYNLTRGSGLDYSTPAMYLSDVRVTCGEAFYPISGFDPDRTGYLSYLLAGGRWDETTAGPGIEVSSDGLTITRPTNGGGADYAGIKATQGRSKGKRYYEIEISANGCSVGAADAAADATGLLGGGTAISWGYWAYSSTDGYLYYRFPDGDNGSINTAGIGGAGVYGVLIDFDTKAVDVYKNGQLQHSFVMNMPTDTVLFPAASIGTGNSATIRTAEPFQFPPQKTFIAWDSPDSALASKVSGVMRVDGSPAARLLKAFTYERLTFALDGLSITDSKPLGQTVSDPQSGEYEIILRDGFPREVIVVAFDDYGDPFEAGESVETGQRIHPSIPNGYVYECTGAGTLPSSEPAWSTDEGNDQLIGTASFRPTPFYRPMVHGPVKPEVVVIEG